MAIIMDGKALAAKMQDHLHEKVERLKEKEWIVARTRGNHGW